MQEDKGGEFKNNIFINYCKSNNIKIINSSPYHPQINGFVEVTHKKIQKYIYVLNILRIKVILMLLIHYLI